MQEVNNNQFSTIKLIKQKLYEKWQISKPEYHKTAPTEVSNKKIIHRVRAVIYCPLSHKFLYIYYRNLQKDQRWSLAGGKIENGEQNLIETLKREILEETGYVNPNIIGKLGDIIYSPRTTETVNANHTYLVLIENYQQRLEAKLSNNEIERGLEIKWEKPESVDFGSIYSQYQIMIDRALSIIK